MSQNFKTKFAIRWVPFSVAALLLASTVVFQPTVQAESALNTVRCASIDAFAVASANGLKAQQQAMEATFTLTINAMQTVWKIEDLTTSAERQVSESAFTSLATAFSNTRGLSTVQKAAVVVYQDLLIKSIHTLETNVDAAEAAYREDMLALVKAHQASLRDLVQAEVDSINAAAATAKANCTQNGVVVTLTGAVAAANATLLAKSIALDAQSVAKAIKIVATRTTAFIQQDTQFIQIATDATKKLTKIILTGHE